MKSGVIFFLLVVFLGGCTTSPRPTVDSFDQHGFINEEIKLIVDIAVRERIKLSELRSKLVDRFGGIEGEFYYNSSSIFDEVQIQSGFADKVRSLKLSSGESLIFLGLDADHACLVVCDKDERINRSAM